MTSASPVNQREARRRVASGAYALAVLLVTVAMWGDGTSVSRWLVVAGLVGGLVLSGVMVAGSRVGWQGALLLEVVRVVLLVVAEPVSAFAWAAQVAVFAALALPGVRRRDAWVHRWGDGRGSHPFQRRA